MKILEIKTKMWQRRTKNETTHERTIGKSKCAGERGKEGRKTHYLFRFH